MKDGRSTFSLDTDVGRFPVATSLTPVPDRPDLAGTDGVVAITVADRAPAPTARLTGHVPRVLGLVLSDAVALALALLAGAVVAALLGGSRPTLPPASAWAVALAAIPSLALSGLYGRVGRARNRLTMELPRIATVLTVFGFLALQATLTFGWHESAYGHTSIFWAWAVAIVTVSGGRAGLRVLRNRAGVTRQRTVIVGAGRIGHLLARKLRHDPNVEVVGFIDSDPIVSVDDSSLPPVLGREDQLVEVMRAAGAERLVIGFSRTPPEHLVELIRSHALHGVDISIVPRYFDVMTGNVDLDSVRGLPLIELRAAGLSPRARAVKRATDLVLTALMLPLLLPLAALIAVIIKLDSPGPVFFRQARRGRGETVFQIIKFRTMRVGAEAQRDALAGRNEASGPLFKLGDDPRITRVGRVLRSTSLDELPQLLNVLKGEMSLVGPRPFVTFEDEQITGWARQRLDVPPGVTGLWQAMGRTDISFEEMLRLDHLYVTRWSFWWDLKILLQTIPAVLMRHNQ